MSSPRILLIDIESAPILAAVWQLKTRYISADAILEDPFTLGAAWKWLGEDTISSVTCKGRNGYKVGPLGALPEKKKFDSMVRRIHQVLSEADGVVHYNGTKFDIPMLNKEFLELGMNPPTPSMEHDLLRTVKQRFRFPSNSLSYVCKRLRIGKKHPHKGLDLWLECKAGNPGAWRTMEDYNRQDIVLTEGLYRRVLPWMRQHINMGLLIQSSERVCPLCGGTSLKSHGPRVKGGQVYRRYICHSCGGWPRERCNMTPSGLKGNGILVI